MRVIAVKTNRRREPEAQSRLHVRNFPVLKPLAESVILQAMEDLLSNFDSDENLAFFQGNGFRLYANIAEMRSDEKNSLLDLIMGTLSGMRLINSQPQSIRVEK